MSKVCAITFNKKEDYECLFGMRTMTTKLGIIYLASPACILCTHHRNMDIGTKKSTVYCRHPEGQDSVMTTNFYIKQERKDEKV